MAYLKTLEAQSKILVKPMKQVMNEQSSLGSCDTSMLSSFAVQLKSDNISVTDGILNDDGFSATGALMSASVNICSLIAVLSLSMMF